MVSPNVLVLDGEQRPALAIVRSLAHSGRSVIVAADRPVSLASTSRYCRRHVTHPSPSVDHEAFTRFLFDFLSDERIDVVLPVTDITTHAVCANQDRLRSLTSLAVPEFEAFQLVSDKSKLMDWALRCGVPIPRTEFVEDAAGLREIAGRVEYPAVVKPARSRIRAGEGWIAAGVQYAYSRTELDRLYVDTGYLAAHPSLIQQRIAGPGVGVFALFDRGVPVAEFAHRRLREKPPSGGASVLCESIAVPPVLRERVVALLGRLGWHGVAMVEFKQDAASGEFFLMEVNGRFWGSLQLAIDAGVDFPRLACDLALGRPPATAPAYRTGVRSRWLFGDLDHLLLRLFKSGGELRLPESAPSRLRALTDVLTCSGRDLHYEIVSADDPRPFLYECAQNARSLAASALGLVRRPFARRARPAPQPPALCSKSSGVRQLT